VDIQKYILEKNNSPSTSSANARNRDFEGNFEESTACQIQSALEDGQLKLEKIHTSQNPADMLTKVVTREKLRICSVSIGLQV